jgi:hypothetical protein
MREKGSYVSIHRVIHSNARIHEINLTPVRPPGLAACRGAFILNLRVTCHIVWTSNPVKSPSTDAALRLGI